jgi:hypothetical protein
MCQNKYKKYIQKNLMLQYGGKKYKIDIDNHFSMVVDYDEKQQKYELYLIDKIDAPKNEMDGEHVAKKIIFPMNNEKNSDVIWNMRAPSNGCWGLHPVYKYQVDYGKIIDDAFDKGEEIILQSHQNK